MGDILENRSGEYWVGTYGGLCRFNPDASKPRFTPYRLTENTFANQINVLLERSTAPSGSEPRKVWEAPP